MSDFNLPLPSIFLASSLPLPSPGIIWLLTEDPQQEITLLMRLKRRRDDAVVTRLEAVASAYLTQVDKGGRFGDGGVVLEETHVQGTAVGVLQLLMLKRRVEMVLDKT